MGIPVSVHLQAAPGADLDEPGIAPAVEAAFDVLHHADAVFSTYRSDSDISRLRAGTVTLEDCDPLVAEALVIGEEAGRVTRGAFTVFLPDVSGDLVFDPTGLVKGWALDMASEVLGARLEEAGAARVAWCINAGGDMVAAVGSGVGPDEGPVWRVGIEHPARVVPGRAADRPEQIAAIVPLRRGGLATSGTSARGAHLVDPATDRPTQRRGSVTVTGPDLLWSDIWATALFVGGRRTREAFDALGAGWGLVEL